LYQTLKLPLPNKDTPLPTTTTAPPRSILIYGGSTAMGITGIQFAALSGLRVITTGSPAHHDYLKSLGAAHVVDYRSPTAPDEIRALTDGKLTLAWDCHADDASATFCARALSADEDEAAAAAPHYSALLYGTDGAVKRVNARIRTDVTLYYTVFGEPYAYKGPREAVPENLEFGAMFWELSRRLLAEGKVKPIRTFVNRDGYRGLEGVIKGMEDGKEGKVRAGKLVYTMD
jgi:NADPH:quinone reductase-like Zn-dependent oxidoreductase